MMNFLGRIRFWRWAPFAYILVALLLGLIEIWDGAVTREVDSAWLALAALLLAGGAVLAAIGRRS